MPSSPQQDSLYNRLGADHLRLLVDRFYGLVQSDDRIRHLFTNKIEVTKEKQFLFLTQFFGGPALYSESYGHPRMRMRHMPHKITADAAFAWLENMSAAIDSLPVEQELKVEMFQRFPTLAARMVNSKTS